MINIVVAVDYNNAIGAQGDLPWKCPEDLKAFSHLTKQGTNPTLIMGRITAESLRKALPGRRNIVVSSSITPPYEGMEVAASFEQALAMVDEQDEVYVIGGVLFFQKALDLPKVRLHLTRLEFVAKDADRWFPTWDCSKWTLTSLTTFPVSTKTINRVVEVWEKK